MAHQCQTRPPSRICGGLRTLCLVLVTLLGSPTAHAAVDVSDLLAELQHMRSKSKDGVSSGALGARAHDQELYDQPVCLLTPH